MNVFFKALENDLEFVKMNYSHLEMTDEKRKTLLHYAVVGSAMDVIKYLLDMDINVNMVDQHGESPLFDCARKGKMDIAKLLISKFAQVNIANRSGELPIHLAAQKGDIDMMRLLIESGSYTNKKSDEDKLPVHYAILGGQVEAVPFLLKEGRQSWMQKDIYGNSLLHYATKTTSVRMIELLLNHELDTNALNDQFETPIFNAIRFGSVDTVKLLTAHDAYLTICNRRYETPLDTALIYDRKDAYQYLQHYIQTPAYERLAQRQALTIAVLNRDHLYLRKLVDKNQTLKKDRLNKTALDYAKEYHLSLCINCLRDLEINGQEKK